MSSVITLLTAILEKLNAYVSGLHNELLEKKIKLDFIHKGINADLGVYDNPNYYNRLISAINDSMALSSIPAALARKRFTNELFKINLDQTEDMRKSQYIYRLLTSKEHAQDIRLFNIGKILSDRYNALWNTLYLVRKKLIKKRTFLTGFLEFLPEVAVIIIITFIVDRSTNVIFCG